MSQHPSLKVDSVGAKHRNVLKRYERIKKMQSEGKWSSDRTSGFSLPKMKSIKVKVKKTKEVPAAEGAAAKGAAASGAAAAPAKGAGKSAKTGKS